MIEKYTTKSAHLLSQNVIHMAFNHCIFNEKIQIINAQQKKNKKVASDILCLLYVLQSR